MRIRCKDLYNAVWEKPVRTLAREWGMSDVGLAKACRKHGIPLPRVGHWAKVAVGRGSPKPPLTGNPDVEITFSGAPSLKRPKLTEQEKQKLAPALRAASLTTSSSQPLATAHWTKKTLTALNKKPDPSGFLHPQKDAFRVSTSESSRERLVRILNILEIALSAAGMEWTIDQKTHFVVGEMFGEKVPFEIIEKYTRSEHVEKHPKDSWLDKRTYTYHFSGDLTIRIDGWYEGRKSWSDGKTKRLEEKLPEVIEGFLAAAKSMHLRTVEHEEQRKRWAENERQRAEKERIAREEKAFLDASIKETNDWAQANTIQQYANYLRRLVNEQSIVLTESGEQWLSRVENIADKLDPAKQRLSS